MIAWLKRYITSVALKCLILLCGVIGVNTVLAQPSNDNCANASVINVPGNGFAKGVFTSTINDITQATIQSGETFAPAILVAGQNDKSMWYKFTIGTTRAVRVTLAQPGTTITAGDAGFAVFKANNCLPNNSNISSKLTPIGTFGNTYHPCVDSGVYYIQVSSNTRANGPLYIQLNISDTTGALYDRPQDAYHFGVVTPHSRRIDYLVSCQSVEDETERCASLANASQYHKSSWHTFTTPAYFDYIAIMLAGPSGNYFVNAATLKKFGYVLYKGNAATGPLSSLIPVGGCDSLMTNGYRAAFRMYKCSDLEPNTTYTIHLLAHETFNADIRLGITVGGTAPTQAPVPVLTNFPATNSFGNLVSTPAGPTRTLTDYLGCNSRHSVTSCNPAIPAGGLTVGSINYNLSTFFTFSLTTTSSVELYGDRSCGQYLYVRLFKQSLTGNCTGLDTANLVASFTRISEIDCLAPGDYVVQLMGTDATVPTNDIYYSTIGHTSNQCLSNNLGNSVSLRLRAYSRQATNNFSLSATGNYDTVNKVANAMAPLVHGINYNLKRDTIGCENTVLPADTSCSPSYTKAIYRQFVVADSGAVGFWNTPNAFQYKLYRGDANALATAQNAFSYPDKIAGLTSVSLCMDYYTTCTDYNNVCVTPGTYTYVSFTNDGQIGNTNAPTMGFDTTRTKFYSPALAQDMGSILDSVSPTGGSKKSMVDMFTCKDNAEVINGYQPCKINNVTATKAIYRQFYLKEDAMVSIAGNGGCGFYSAPKTLFNGKATDGLSTLTPVGAPWNCFTSVNSASCRILPAGWYTVVSYGVGPTYDQPLKDLGLAGSYASNITKKEEFTVTVIVCPSPKYNRPYKASVTASKQPHVIEWKYRVGSTPAYPRTDTIYTLPTENFNCIDDTPFVSHPVIACDTTMRKVAYWVFQTTQLSYAVISTGNYWGAVYALDVRTDSSLLTSATPIQPCVRGDRKIQLCRLLPGTYTLVVFAPSGTGCTGVTPSIHIDAIEGSRFDHAINAYDFGAVPPDSTWHRGKLGEVNPVHPLRAGSSDFFSCITGSAASDPTNSLCESDNIYNMYDPSKKYMYEGTTSNGNHIVRRNLWYTFVIDKPGWFHVKVENKTPGKTAPGYRFAVYRSDVDGNLSYSDIIAQGLVDSVVGANGLVHMGHNGWPNYCNALKEGLSFYRDPCTQFAPQRYYIVVDNRNSYGYYDRDLMNPNNQLEVAILLDSINLVPTKYDHYYKAYDFDSVGVGVHIGGTDNFTCATRNSRDPISGIASCTKTLWYRFTSTITGNVRYRIKVNGVVEYSTSDIRLFQEVIPGDSTTAGLIYKGGSSVRGTDNTWWTQHCVSPGVWYLLLPGCDRVNENVVVEIELLEQEGDFCSRPLVVSMAGAGTTSATTIINCHTIGTDYGEFNPTLTCPVDGETGKYKSSWFRLDITSNDTLDVTTFISENTNVLPSAIKYRMMTGDCSAMQEQSCVLDAQTQNTYKCLTAGSYYFQVFVPTTTTPTGSTLVTGDISLQLSAVTHVDTCAPINDCLANANFIPQFDCTSDTSVRFRNFSTYGESIRYEWDFGYAGQTSTAVSPAFDYPRLATDQTYTVTLRMRNLACNGADTVSLPITIPGRPNFNLGPDTSLCAGGNVTLNATSWPGSTYRWSTNAITATINTTGTGVRTYWARVTYNGCINTDTIRVYVNTITPRNQNRILCGSTVQLSSARSVQEEHLWSTGETTAAIDVSDSGYYYNNISWYGCTIQDTFNVIMPVLPFGNDTSVCFKQPFRLNALSEGATGYLWSNNSTASTLNATAPGEYWVQVNYGTSCSRRDTIMLAEVTAVINASSTTICAGQTFTLPSGKIIDSAGTYNDTARYASGCDSVISSVEVSVTTLSETVLNETICSGSTFTLPWGGVVNTTGSYSDVMQGASGCDSIKNTIHLTVNEKQSLTTAAAICAGDTYTLPSGVTINQPGTYYDTIRYRTGCDSLVSTVQLTVGALSVQNISAAICSGENYTLPSGRIVSLPGIYRDTVRYNGGCDSLISTTDLAVKEITRTSLSATVCDGENFTLPSGRIVNTTGTFSDTLRYAAGCDSVITTVNLTVKTITRIIAAPVLCNGQTYTLPSGTPVAATGMYRDTIKYVVGCDSIVAEINLTVLPAVQNITSAIICSGEAYTLPSGVVVNTTGIHYDTIRYATGCDSLLTRLDLTVKPVIKIVSNVAQCEGYTYTLPSGVVVDSTGIYVDTIRYITGCDSLISTISFTLMPVTRVTVVDNICEGQAYTLPNGTVVNLPGTYIDTIRTNARCDSIITTTLSVKQLFTQAIIARVCAGQSYTLPSGTVVATTGIYLDTLRYISGCDSLVSTVGLTVVPLLRSSASATICEGQTFTLPSGDVVNTTGSYSDTLRYQSGCDSLIRTTQLIVLNLGRKSVVQKICEGDSYQLPSGTVVNATGIYHDTLRYVSGCDSFITTVDLAVQPLAKDTLSFIICEGETHTLPSASVVSASGTYVDTLHYITGCDSIITTTNLVVNPLTRISSAGNICQGQNYTLPSGTVVNITGIYRDTLRYVNGCDSVITVVQLSVQALTRVSRNASICVGQSFTLPSGKVVNTTGTFVDTVRYASACDSLISTITISHKTVSRQSASATICAGSVYTMPSGKDVNTAGTHVDTVRYISGCDSLITTLALQVKTVRQNSLDETICSGASVVLPSGNTVSTTGLHRDTLRYTNGCDSLVTILNLQVKVPVTYTVSPSICEGEIYTLPSGQVVSSSGQYVDIIKGAMGCDSIITNINLQVNANPNLQLSKTNDINCTLGTTTITASGGRTYRWSPVDGLSNPNISNPVAAPQLTTVYSVECTSVSGCTTTDSITVYVDKTGTEGGYQLPSAFTPNGDGKNDCFGVKTWGWVSGLQFTVFDRWGNIVFTTTNPSNCWDGSFNGDKSGTGAYVYTITAHTICGAVVRKGTIVLIR